MGKGYMGKILMVDLTSKEIHEEVIPDNVYRQYLSGTGLASYILYNRIPAGADPLGPDNILGFMSGLLTGTGVLFAGRWMVVGKSPLTGGWGDANCGGNFSPAIKRCGYDGIFFSGISEKPVYLYINNGRVEIRDASHVWGKDAVEAEKILIQETGGHSRVALIGPSGEKLSLISGICNDRGRLAARSGLGAVMGSKKLKAVVLDGAKRIPVHDRDEIKKLSQKCNKWVQFQPPFLPGPMMAWVGALMRFFPTQLALDGMLYKTLLRKWGTVSMNQMSIEMGDAPIKNWKGSNEDFGPELSARISPDVFSGPTIARYHCYACPLGCGGRIRTDALGQTHRPEYETVLSLGGLCMNTDADSIFRMNDKLNRAGMDTISAGGTLAFAMECFEKGLIRPEDTDGLDLTWGNSRAMEELLDRMIHREGIGDLLADGVRKAAAKIGKGSEQYAMHVQGSEVPMHDPKFQPGLATTYKMDATPA
ncbi:MAG: aldehyde ferredoxin oxidoreductase family protein, partial [Deltaproteobacteria bacterium]|nr:aldehyde ferredoxin oxidoreductase family protein [Deltaproteobacteria bacterium]